MSQNPFAELLSIIVSMYVSIILLRFFLQYLKADFYNPLSQFVVKVTDPLLRPLRKIIPGIAGLDIASIVLAWLVFVSSYLLITLFSGSFNINIAQLIIFPIYQIIDSGLNLFMFLVFVRAIMSWIPSAGYNPIVALFHQLTEPLLAKCRKLLPANTGIDFSPIIALLGLLFTSRVIDYYLFPIFQGLSF